MSALTPSEQIVLTPDEFGEEVGMLGRKVELPDGRKLGSERLGKAVIAAALLANEAAGVLRLEIREGKALFGLMKTRKLFAARSGSSASWPESSLEAAVAEGLRPDGVEVSQLVQDIIQQDRTDPAAWLVQAVQAGLGERELLRSEAGRVMKVFTVSRWVATDASRQAAAAGASEAKTLLQGLEKSRPALHAELDKSIRTALAFMTESSSD